MSSSHPAPTSHSWPSHAHRRDCPSLSRTPARSTTQVIKPDWRKLQSIRSITGCQLNISILKLDYYLTCKPQTIDTIVKLPSQSYINVWLTATKKMQFIYFFKTTDFNKLFWVNGNLVSLLNQSLHKIVFQFQRTLSRTYWIQFSEQFPESTPGCSKQGSFLKFLLSGPYRCPHTLVAVCPEPHLHTQKHLGTLPARKRSKQGQRDY